MATTNITITSSDTNNNSVQKTITGINPDATSAQLVSAAQKIVALTDNTYVKTDRVDKTNCDTEASGDMKTVPTFTLEKTTFTVEEVTAGVTTPITTNSDGQFWFGKFSGDYQGSTGLNLGISVNPPDALLRIQKNSGSVVSPSTFVFGVFETATYKAAEITVTITE